MDESRLRKGIGLGLERSFEQDPKYSLRLLVDIAIRALSPAVNDPTTAVQAIAEIEDLVLCLGRDSVDRGCVVDKLGALRLIFPTPPGKIISSFPSMRFDNMVQGRCRCCGGCALP